MTQPETQNQQQLQQQQQPQEEGSMRKPQDRANQTTSSTHGGTSATTPLPDVPECPSPIRSSGGGTPGMGTRCSRCSKPPGSNAQKLPNDGILAHADGGDVGAIPRAPSAVP
ncbi:hypothetical protein BSKO_02999 [Bryopsis sp. KO-2023]|nr:hypothetical protein BSKO_02999 [Bryopsis sp. KO-2023]